jgi:hypothetical protein
VNQITEKTKYLPTRKFSQGSSIPRTNVESTHIFQRQKYWARAFDGFAYAFLRRTVVMCLPIVPVVPQLEAGSQADASGEQLLQRSYAKYKYTTRERHIVPASPTLLHCMHDHYNPVCDAEDGSPPSGLYNII